MTRWEWDPEKAASNVRKHGVTFDLAVSAMNDPLMLSLEDPHEDGNRFQTTALVPAVPFTLLFIIHTEPVPLNGGKVGRIISARRASRRERRIYEEGQS